MLLLDTCTFLWWATGDATVPGAVAERLRDPDEPIFLSAVSAWEICVKYGLGKLPLPDPPSDYIRDRRQKLLITPLGLDEADVVNLIKLPPLHCDPFDRMLVSQAIARGMTLVTPDPAVRAYPCRTWWG